MKNLFKTKEIGNAAWIIGEQVFQMLLTFIVGILSARYLGPSNYGLISYTSSFVSFVIPVVTLGMDGVIIKKMIAAPKEEGLYLGSCILYRSISALLCSISIILIVLVSNPNDMLMLSLISLQSIQLFFRAINILDAWFQRHLLSKYVSIAKMIASILVSGYRIFLLISDKDVRWFALSNSLSTIVITIILLVFYKINAGQKLKVYFKYGLNVLKESYHFIISGIMSAIYGQMDRVMLGEMLSSEAVGLYTIAATICSMWIFIPTAIINSLRPGILEHKNSGNEMKYICNLRRLYSIIIYLCIAVSIVIFVLGDYVVNLLYGYEYSGAITALKVLIWSEVFSMLGVARGIWILAENKNKYVKYYLFMGVILNLFLNLMLIPKYGIIGAAVATLSTQIFTSLISPLLFKETREHTKIVLQSINIKNLKI